MLCCRKKKKKKMGSNIVVLERVRVNGLKNMGNSCYINSVLHSLFSINMIKTFISSKGYTVKTPVLFFLSKIYDQINSNQPFSEYKKYIFGLKQVTNWHYVSAFKQRLTGLNKRLSAGACTATTSSTIVRSF